MKRAPFIVGLAGGTASGKTTTCNRIVAELASEEVTASGLPPQVVQISMDSFYSVLTPEQLENVADYNFDHPDAFDVDLFRETLRDLKDGNTVEVPIYDFTTHSRKKETVTVHPAEVILVEGILAFHDPEVRELMDMKIFVDTDSDTRLARRVRRDINERGREIDGVLAQYERFVKPAFDEFVYPTKRHADVILPRGAGNTVGINLIVQHVSGKLTPSPKQSPTTSPTLMD